MRILEIRNIIFTINLSMTPENYSPSNLHTSSYSKKKLNRRVPISKILNNVTSIVRCSSLLYSKQHHNKSLFALIQWRSYVFCFQSLFLRSNTRSLHFFRPFPFTKNSSRSWCFALKCRIFLIDVLLFLLSIKMGPETISFYTRFSSFLLPENKFYDC